MAQFFKFLFASCLGTCIALFVMTLIGISTIAGIAASSEEPVSIKANSVLALDLSQPIPELTNNMELNSFDFNQSDVLGLHDVIRAIRAAEDDDDIKGIYLENGSIGTSITGVRKIRQALMEFKESGKFVTSFAPNYSQGAYYLASAGDDIYVGPLGVTDFRGLGAEIPFFKNALDRLGIKMEVFYAGNYKSATEPFRRTEMSDYNREQTKEYLGALWSVIVADVAAGRGVTPADVQRAAADMTGFEPKKMIAAKLIDGELTRTEVNQLIRQKLSLEDDDEDVNSVRLSEYFSARVKGSEDKDGEEIALVVAEGTIVDGKGAAGNIGGDKYARLIDKLRRDDEVKAIVLRINSGGGSASASENMWYAIEKFKTDTGKPVVVSMGNVAASGGYYMAANADSIFAEPTTITGSIGVFLTFPMVQEFMNDKLGITFDTVGTTSSANEFSLVRPLSPAAEAVLQRRTEAIYDQFKDRVATGRKLDRSIVDTIAQGRVYAGTRALELGLVDRLGDTKDALNAAAKMAGLDNDYHAVTYPKAKNFFEQLMEDLFEKDDLISRTVMKKTMGKAYEHYRNAEAMSRLEGPQMLLPVVIPFE